MKTTKGISAAAWFYGQSFHARVYGRPLREPDEVIGDKLKLPCTRPNCQDPECDRDHAKKEKR